MLKAKSIAESEAIACSKDSRRTNSDFAVGTKLWAFLCIMPASFFITDYRQSAVLTMIGFVYLIHQRKWRILKSMAASYVVIVLLMIGIRFYGLRTIIIPEFYVFLFWSIYPTMLLSWDLITTPTGELAAFLSRIRMPVFVILGVLVIFRFVPTMRSQLQQIRSSMKNRGLLEPLQVLRHPFYTGEYVLIPLLLRCIQIADQLAVSAVTRGAECPEKRSSYYEKRMRAADYLWQIVWSLVLIAVIAKRIRLW